LTLVLEGIKREPATLRVEAMKMSKHPTIGQNEEDDHRD
jgi:hypothetical protein